MFGMASGIAFRHFEWVSEACYLQVWLSDISVSVACYFQVWLPDNLNEYLNHVVWHQVLLSDILNGYLKPAIFRYGFQTFRMSVRSMLSSDVAFRHFQ
ncbi:hypothetical protein CEXT_103401 [Caerostris extrusa]|uniref:Uncharacterized protein n=1 Tax=Caerostris extrusa TaxID=172846 RepID=A0AAV4PDX0_CAEEX|nr:hypothetical protein CEXT_103401 [Caerostris extrusa]